MASASDKKNVQVTVQSRKSSSDSDTIPIIQSKTPRTARFIEATSVNSPTDSSARMPFSERERTSYYKPQAQIADVGFGYIGGASSSASEPGVEMPMTPKSPLKSAMKTPGAAPRNFENILSPTFKEEQKLDDLEKSTEKEQAKDLKVKIRVRLAKVVLRSTNFACSLIVLSMLATTFSIFNATKALPPRSNLPPWAVGTNPWPQIVLLVISCTSLLICMIIFYGYFRGGHKRAEKVAMYYSVFAVGFFGFSIIMWGIGAGVLQGAKSNSEGKDVWGWACNDNLRKSLFESDVSYDLVCRLQNWSLVCCIIEIVVEVITILIYGIVFYRYWSKKKLRKSMANRDAARSDLYLAQLRAQSAPNTPAPYSPRDGGYNPMFSPRFAHLAAEKDASTSASTVEVNEAGVRYIDATQKSPQKPFVLRAPPTKSTTPKSQHSETFQPQVPGASFSSVTPPSPGPGTPGPLSPRVAEHVPAAPGEQTYDAVPIPGAYTSPLQSPSHPPQGYYSSMHQ